MDDAYASSVSLGPLTANSKRSHIVCICFLLLPVSGHPPSSFGPWSSHSTPSKLYSFVRVVIGHERDGFDLISQTHATTTVRA
jgi:hypothetical protein